MAICSHSSCNIYWAFSLSWTQRSPEVYRKWETDKQSNQWTKCGTSFTASSPHLILKGCCCLKTFCGNTSGSIFEKYNLHCDYSRRILWKTGACGWLRPADAAIHLLHREVGQYHHPDLPTEVSCFSCRAHSCFWSQLHKKNPETSHKPYSHWWHPTGDTWGRCWARINQ